MSEPFQNNPDGTHDVLVAMSGGVDSTVAALLLEQSGYDVIGATMQLFHDESFVLVSPSSCCSSEEIEQARRACARMGIPHCTFDMKGRFREDVVERFCQTYIDGGTPNPCIDCNKHLKFEALQRKRQELGAEYVATGHYARRQLNEETRKWELLRGADRAKDQSYVLYGLSQDDLAHMLFPLGELTKGQVRELAREAGFANAEREESQDICFVPDGNYRKFIERYMGADQSKPPFCEGEIVDLSGKILGKHNGLIGYTVGQRRGIGIASSEPLYVYAKDEVKNQLIVAPKDLIVESEAIVDNLNLISGEPESAEFMAEVQTWYKQKPVPALIKVEGADEISSSSADPSTHASRAQAMRAKVEYLSPHVRTAPGQSIVIYDGDKVIGGGIAR